MIPHRALVRSTEILQGRSATCEDLPQLRLSPIPTHRWRHPISACDTTYCETFTSPSQHILVFSPRLATRGHQREDHLSASRSSLSNTKRRSTSGLRVACSVGELRRNTRCRLSLPSPSMTSYSANLGSSDSRKDVNLVSLPFTPRSLTSSPTRGQPGTQSG